MSAFNLIPNSYLKRLMRAAVQCDAPQQALWNRIRHFDTLIVFLFLLFCDLLLQRGIAQPSVSCLCFVDANCPDSSYLQVSTAAAFQVFARVEKQRRQRHFAVLLGCLTCFLVSGLLRFCSEETRSASHADGGSRRD